MSWSSTVIRPKSIATVVVVLPRTPDRSSIPSDSAVITASVVSGVISETEPTNVVLPTPKPPAITILTGIGADPRPAPGWPDPDCGCPDWAYPAPWLTGGG